MLLFFMLKGTRILLYLGGEVFHYIESAYSLVDFLKKKKYKKTSRKATTDTFDKKFTNVTLWSFKWLLLSYLLGLLPPFLILQFLLYLNDELKARKAVVFNLY